MVSHHHAKRAPRLCCVCKKVPLVQYGRCHACFRAMNPLTLARLRNMTRAERKAEFEKMSGQTEMPRWAFEGNEPALIEMTERLQRENQEKEKSK